MDSLEDRVRVRLDELDWDDQNNSQRTLADALRGVLTDCHKVIAGNAPGASKLTAANMIVRIAMDTDLEVGIEDISPAIMAAARDLGGPKL